MKPDSTIETGVAKSFHAMTRAADAIADAATCMNTLRRLQDPAEQATALSTARSFLLDAQKAVAEAVYASGEIRLTKPGKVAA